MQRYKKVAAENRKAFFDFHISETFEAGIVLRGNEVKSVRLGRVNLRDSFVRAEKNEIWAHGIHISPYGYERREQVDPLRPRKLLLKKPQIKRLVGKSSEKGLAMIPLKIYFSGNYAKLEIGLGKGKKIFDKRESIKRKDMDREMERDVIDRGA